ncbi:MAG: tyrosine-protein phosphatase, partial [Pseudomonadota bacterium]
GEDRLPAATELINDPITGDRSAELSRVAQAAIRTANFDQLPAEINYDIHAVLMDEAEAQYGRLLRTIADPENRPLAFHCSHGVHRTGTASAILLSALGVPWETVREDYVLTNEVRADYTEESLMKLRAMAAKAKGIAPEAVDMTNVEAFYLLEGAYIDAALAKAEEKYGSMDGYLTEGLGLSEAEITSLRASLLE